MPLPIGLNPVSSVDVDLLAKSIKSDLNAMGVGLVTWRASINGGGQLISQEVERHYQAMTAARVKVETNKVIPGLGVAYARLFNGYNAANLAADWAATKSALDPLIDWLRTNWPEKTATSKYAFLQEKVSTQELEAFNVSITAPQRATLVALIDAVLATLS